VFVYIDDFIWLPDIIEKLAIKHQVTQDEAKERRRYEQK